MLDFLLQTKLHIPQTRRHCVQRHRLTDRLTQGRVGKLTIISAPAGYGKTTLVAEWLRLLGESTHASGTTQTCHTWLTLDESDNDPAYFLRYFATALQQLDTCIGRTVLEILQANQAGNRQYSPNGIMGGLINDMMTLQRVDEQGNVNQCIIALDEYQLINNQTIHDAISFWLDHQPSHVHLVIIGRSAPPLPLPRLRVRHQLNEINSKDLQFTLDEAADFLNSVMQLNLSAADVAKLDQQTEGWIAGLQLAALSLQITDDPQTFVQQFTGTDYQVMDYLMAEVLSNEAEDVRWFLLYTSILTRFTADLCNVLTGQTTGHTLLRLLEQRNLFAIPLDNQRQWYRYHPIFAEFLQARLQQALLPDADHRIRQLHATASDWFAQQGLMDEAIDHAIHAKDYAKLVAYLHNRARQMLWQENRPRTVGRWCSQLPEDVLLADAVLAVTYGWALMYSGLMDELTVYLAKLDVVYKDLHESEILANNILAGLSLSDLSGELATLYGEVEIYAGRITSALTWLQKAEASLTAQNPTMRAIARQVQGFAYYVHGDVANAEKALRDAILFAKQIENTSLHIFAQSDLAATYVIAGRLQDAHNYLNELIKLYPDVNQTQSVSSLLTYPFLILANIYYEWNQLGEAQACIDHIMAHTKEKETVATLIHNAKLTWAKIKQAQGDWKTATRLLAEAEVLASKGKSLRFMTMAGLVKAQLHLQNHKGDEVAEWIEAQMAMGISDNDGDDVEQPAHQVHEIQVVIGRYLLSCQDIPAAIDHLLHCQAEAQGQGWTPSLVKIHILLAQCYVAQKDTPQALAHLQQSLALAEPEAFIRTFIDEGAPLTSLLRQAAEKGIAPAYVGKLQAAFMPSVKSEQPLIDPLTKRELEVLGHLADGLSNPEIAEKMIVATGTIAKYTNNIFSKLGVRNRTEAANRAQTLGLL
ncbi:MAG: LuxR C-terminal-related transcriptional regulator [Chloroflexota bacterium]